MFSSVAGSDGAQGRKVGRPAPAETQLTHLTEVDRMHAHAASDPLGRFVVGGVRASEAEFDSEELNR